MKEIAKRYNNLVLHTEAKRTKKRSRKLRRLNENFGKFGDVAVYVGDDGTPHNVQPQVLVNILDAISEDESILEGLGFWLDEDMASQAGTTNTRYITNDDELIIVGPKSEVNAALRAIDSMDY